MLPLTYDLVRRLVTFEPSSQLLPAGRRVGFENTALKTVAVFACRRRGCANTFHGKWNFCCRACWGELSLKMKKNLLDVIGWLNGHADDADDVSDGAEQIREAFIAIASHDWEPKPEPRRTDQPDGRVRELVYVGGRRR